MTSKMQEQADQETRIHWANMEEQLAFWRRKFPGFVVIENPLSPGQILIHNPAAPINITLPDEEK